MRIALLNNRGLRADLLGLGVARGQLVQASLFPNLDFEAQVRFSHNPEREDGTGWYSPPPGSVADVASADDLAADGVDPRVG